MIIEKILPINYYNELSGLMTDSSIAQNLLKKNFPKTYQFLEPSGGMIYLNNAINKWLLTIFISRVSDIYSNLIWDLFLLEGNIVLFKALYAFIFMLEPYILKCKTFDEINKNLNHCPKHFEKRAKLAFYLIGKKFSFNIEMIKQYRKKILPGIIKEITGLGDFLNEEMKKKKKKNLICSLKSPICIDDKKNLNETYDNIILKQLDKPKVIEDYIDNDEYYNKNKIIKDKKENTFEDLLIERKKHFCNLEEKFKLENKNEDIKDIEINNINNINKINNDIFEKDNNNNIDNENSSEDISMNELNNINNKNINEIVNNAAKDNEKNMNFQKEKIDDSLMSFDSQ